MSSVGRSQSQYHNQKTVYK